MMSLGASRNPIEFSIDLGKRDERERERFSSFFIRLMGNSRLSLFANLQRNGKSFVAQTCISLTYDVCLSTKKNNKDQVKETKKRKIINNPLYNFLAFIHSFTVD